MSEQTCTTVREAAAEYALGILPPGEREHVAAHLLRCGDCRREVDDMTRIGDELMELIPAAEPPLGFDRKVLVAVRSPRRRFGPSGTGRSWVAGGVAGLVAAAAAVAVLFGLGAGSGRPVHTTEQSAQLVSDGHVIGTVYTEGNPLWVWMKVEGAAVSGPVTCDVVEGDGSVVELGSFDLVGGSGSWAAPAPSKVARISGTRLVTAGGRVVAVATFRS